MSTTDPLVRLAEIEIDPDALDAYRDLLAEQIDAAVSNEPGVLALYALGVQGRPEHIRVVEIYADRAAYEAHLQTPHFLKYKAETAKMVRALTLIDTDPIALRAKDGLGFA